MSKSDAIREPFLEMAKTWIIAAAQIDEVRNKLPSLAPSLSIKRKFGLDCLNWERAFR